MNSESESSSEPLPISSTTEVRRLFEIGLDTSLDLEKWQPPGVEQVQQLLPESKFRVEKLVGRGGMGAVYECHHLWLDQKVAIKLLPALLALDQDYVERFKGEAKKLRRLDHPGIVKVHDLDQTKSPGGDLPGFLYMVMDFVEGESLEQRIEGERKRSGTPAEGASKEGNTTLHLLKLGAQICDALAYTHGRGIVHRDIKPSNILISRNPDHGEERAVIVDFGISLATMPGATRFTRPGRAFASGVFTAPERQMSPSSEPDQREDIYSLGVVLYELFTGRLPVGTYLPPSKCTSIPLGQGERLDLLVRRAMEHEPSERYQHASDVKNDLDVILSAACAAILPHPSNVNPAAATSTTEAHGTSLPQKTSPMKSPGKAIFICGLLSWIPPIAPLFWIPTIVSGHIAHRRAKEQPPASKGWMLKAGIIFAYSSLCCINLFYLNDSNSLERRMWIFYVLFSFFGIGIPFCITRWYLSTKNHPFIAGAASFASIVLGMLSLTPVYLEVREFMAIMAMAKKIGMVGKLLPLISKTSPDRNEAVAKLREEYNLLSTGDISQCPEDFQFIYQAMLTEYERKISLVESLPEDLTTISTDQRSRIDKSNEAFDRIRGSFDELIKSHYGH